MAGPKRAALAEESAEVEVLSANLGKLKSLSKKIEGSLSRLETSGRTVQDAIGPVYGNTQQLQIVNTNADSILAAIDRTRQPLDMRKGEERILRSRPDRVGLVEYISSMDRTNQQLRSLKATNMRSNQQAMAELSNLLQVGSQNLEEVFREICRQDAVPLEPLQFVMKGKDFPRLSTNKEGQLRTINTQIADFASQMSPGEMTPSARGYASERGQYIMMSLQNLSAASISTARRKNASEVYRRENCGIGLYAKGVQGMYTAEYDNICGIFGRGEWGAVLATTCQSSLAVFASTLKELDSYIKQNLLTDCYLAYEIVDVVSKTSFELEERTGELKLAISDALKPVRETAKSSLSTLLADTRSKSQQLVALPQDGAAVSLTSEVMQRLQLMTEYLSPLSSIMRSLGDGGWSAPSNATSSSSVPTLRSFDVGADGVQLFAHYCADTIETLMSNLDGRSRVLHKSRALQSVFIANNVAVVERMIRSSELAPLLGNTQSKIEAWKKKASNGYVDAWKEVSKELLDVQYTSKQQRPPSTSGASIDSAAVLKAMSSKDKDGIKEKFRNFNIAFDDHLAKHKSYKMEPEVRRQLGRDVQSFIEPLYSRFWERYHEIDKGKGKYVKYDKGQLSSMLATL